MAAGVHRFGKPRANVGVSPRLGALGEIDTHSRSCRGQECRRVLNHAAIGSLPPQPNVLNYILSLGRASEHAVGNAEQTRTHSGKNRKTIIVFAGFWVKANGRMRLR